MRLRLFFLGTSIDGSGSDQTGAFDIRGSFCAEDGMVTIRKAYATHNVHYEGRWDGAMIHGQWQINERWFVDQGVFELWPEIDESTQSATREAECQLSR